MTAGTQRQSIAELIAAGLAHHRRGELGAAELIYKRVLASEPTHADALHLLGVLKGRADPQTGVRLVELAIAANPRSSIYYNNLGNLLLRTGDLAGAEQSYRQALLVDAGNADACVNLGNLLSTTGRDAEARACFGKALELAPGCIEACMAMGRVEERAGNWTAAEICFRRVTEAAPGYAPAWLMLSGVSKARGDFGAAEEELRRAVEEDPGYADAYCNLGNLLREGGRSLEAVDCYRQAIELCSTNAADAWNNLGVTLSALGRHEEAVAALVRAVESRPEYKDAYFNLAKEAILLGQKKVGFDLLAKVLVLDPEYAGAYLELGNLQRGCGRLNEAVESYKGALAKGIANSAAVWSNLGVVLAELTRFDEAEAALGEALALDADSSSAWCNRGVLEEKQGRLGVAVAAYRRAVELDADSFEARMNLASVLAQMGEEEGLALLDELVREEPLSAYAQRTRGFSLMLHGRYVEGWAGLEWRDRVKAIGNVPRNFAAPRWQGEALEGRTILLYAEQGFGDTLQFVRYVPVVISLGGRVVLEVQPELRRLLENVLGATVCVAGGELPEFDLHAPLMSLPFLLGTTMETIPAVVAPWVVPGRAVRAGGRLRVGLVWAGNPKHKRDYARSIGLGGLQGLAGVEGVSFVSLQVGAAEAEIAEYGAGFGFVERAVIRDFLDTAEIVAELDLVISVDSAVAHLAGTLQVPVWVLLDNCRDWRWGLVGERTPWYSSARLFRQGEVGGWDGAVEEVIRALRVERGGRLA